MLRARRRLAVLARGSLTVSLEGETGTGKSAIAARFLHPRSGRTGAFVTADLSTVPPDLLPAHLIGSQRGSFTGAVADRKGLFELAHRGTLFLDELQNATPEVQKLLLVALQERRIRPLGAAREIPVDVKLIASSGRPFAEAVSSGALRADLWMRLGPATRVVLPPLRERRGDLPFLFRRFAVAAAKEPENAELVRRIAEGAGFREDAPFAVTLGGRDTPPDRPSVELFVPAPVFRSLERHGWPGNVRELDAVARNLVVFTLVAAADVADPSTALGSARLQADPALVAEMLAASAAVVPAAAADGKGRIDVRIEPARSLSAAATAVERQYLGTLFERTGGDLEAMAEALLGDRSRARAIRLRMNQIGLSVKKLRESP